MGQPACCGRWSDGMETWKAVSWDAALDHIAGRLRDLIEAGKPIGVLGSPRATNEENYLAGRLAQGGP